MPTAPVAYESRARDTYEARVRRALVSLGSKNPDGDIKATDGYLRHCKGLKLEPAVTAAGIYATVHHRHEPTSVLRGAEVSEAPRGYKTYDAVTPEGDVRKVQFWAQRHGYEMLGYPVPLEHGVWSVGVRFPDGERSVVKVQDQEVERLWAAKEANGAASGAAEAPRYRRRSGPDPQVERELDTKRRAAYNAKKSELTSGLKQISGEELFQKHKTRPPEGGRETVAVLSDAKTNEPTAILWKWEGWGYGESGGISTTYWLLPRVSSGASEARRKRSRAEDSAPCNRLERGGVTGDCAALAKEIGPIETDKDLYRLFAPRMKKETQEIFCVASVDVQGMVCGYTEVARGQVSKVHVDVEDVLQAVLAIKPRPSAFAVSHCHPSGKATPSDADKQLTDDIRRAAKAAMPNTVFMDHLIVGGGNSSEYYSFTDLKLKHFST
jgi:RadC-like JAB domain